MSTRMPTKRHSDRMNVYSGAHVYIGQPTAQFREHRPLVTWVWQKIQRRFGQPKMVIIEAVTESQQNLGNFNFFPVLKIS